MVYRTEKKLKKLDDKQLYEDIKKYIKYSHSFYETRVPELKVLAKRLHEEYSLRDFYNVFNRFWQSGSARQMSLAIHTLQLFKEDFDLITWRFIKQKLKEIKSWDKIDSIALNIIGEILLKNPEIGIEIIKFARLKNIWMKRAAIVSTIPTVRQKDFRIALQIVNEHLYDKGEYSQKAIGWVLKEIGEQKPDSLRIYIKDNINMPLTTFFAATEAHKELRNLRELEKEIKTNKFNFWR